VLLLKRSILTEKVARRGFHLSSEYAIDPLEILFARDVMRTHVIALPASSTVAELRRGHLHLPTPRGQHLFPVIDPERRVKGVLTRSDLTRLIESAAPSATLNDSLRPPVFARTDEPLRVVVLRMAESGFTRMPVLNEDSGQLAGMISLTDLLAGRLRTLTEERHRERVLRLRVA
jgi:CBS domain-containing protein